MTSDCPISQRQIRAIAAILLLLAITIGVYARVSASPQHGEPSHPATTEAAHPQVPGTAHETTEGHESGWFATVAKAFNFAVLVGILVYYLKNPIGAYLSSRIVRVREDLVTAAAMRETATRQLAEIEAKLKALPAELEALKRRGAEEIAAERARIEAAAESERQRLREQARREIDMRLRLARRELLEFAASLAVGIAAERIRHSITPADQVRLVDRYAAQISGAPS